MDFLNKIYDVQTCIQFIVQKSIQINSDQQKNEPFASYIPYTDEELLQLGISYLQLFVQENFVGPSIILTLPECLLGGLESISELSIDGVELNFNVVYPNLLLKANQLFRLSTERQSNSDYRAIAVLWYIRSLFVHQQCLTEPVRSLYDTLDKLCTILWEHTYEKPIVRTQVLLEVLQIYISYRRIDKSKVILDAIKETLHVKLDLTGILGLRTKYQVKPLPQLALNVTSCNDENPIEGNRCNLPKLLQLDDDVRLEKYTFMDKDQNPLDMEHALSDLVQALIFGNTQYIQHAQAKDELSVEELQPYIRSLLNQTTGPWSIRISTLFLNIRLESTHKRTVERSLKQCEEILSIINKSENYSVEQRSYLFYTSYARPKWHLELELANLMMSLGLVKSALNIYLKLQKWDDVVRCYMIPNLGLAHKAVEIIQQEINKKPNVELYCLLGDATNDASWYEKAWIFSGEKSGQAQRCWGCYYFVNKEYNRAIPFLQKSLEINSLQESIWARLGYAAMSVGNWQLASTAYLRYTQLEPHGFESWNNLAKAYIKLGDKRRAHKVLQEALKSNFNNWMVWENYLLVSIDTGNFEDALNAYNRLVELNKKYFDKQIIDILMGAIINGTPDANGISANRLRSKAKMLLAHLCVQHPNEGFLWELASELTDAKDSISRAQKLQRSYRAYTQGDPDWSKKPVHCIKILKLCQKLSDVSIQAAEIDINQIEKESENAANTVEPNTIMLSKRSVLSSARLTLQGCIRITKAAEINECSSLISSLESSQKCIEELLFSMNT